MKRNKLVLLAGMTALLVGFSTLESKADFTITNTGSIMTNSSSGTGCPGSYTGYATFMKTNPAYGWKPSTNTTIHTATIVNNTNVAVEFVGKLNDSGCNTNSVIVPHPPFSTAYRFAVYFKSTPLPTNCVLTLSGFNP